MTADSRRGGQALAPGILVVETSTADGKIGAILGRDGALAIDAGIDADEGRRLAAALAEVGRMPDRLVYTHAHLDHVLGGAPWIGGEVLAHRDASDHVRAQLPAWAERFGRSEQDIAGSLAWPTIRFHEPTSLDLGDREVRLLPTPGHAPGATCVFAPADGVLFGGDTVVTSIPPSFKDGDASRFESTLRDLAGLPIEVLVPGHGAIIRGRSAIRDVIVWSADYLARCLDHVSARLDRSVEDVIAEAPFEAFIGDRLPADRNRMPWRHEQTIRTLFSQLKAE